MEWVRAPLAEATAARPEEERGTAAAPTVPNAAKTPPQKVKPSAPAVPTAAKTPPQKVKPSATIETAPEACTHPKKHVWDPQTSGAYVKTGWLGGLCIGPCERSFVETRPEETERGKKFHPTIKKPAVLCRICKRGMCYECHLDAMNATAADSGRTRRRGGP